MKVSLLCPIPAFADELRVFLLEEEVRDLRNALASEKNKNARLMRVIEQKVLEQQKR